MYNSLHLLGINRCFPETWENRQEVYIVGILRTGLIERASLFALRAMHILNR